MQIRIVFPGKHTRTVELPDGATVHDAIEEAVVNSDTYQHELNYRPTSPSVKLKDGDVIILRQKFAPTIR